jgi:hypothetical protein
MIGAMRLPLVLPFLFGGLVLSACSSSHGDDAGGDASGPSVPIEEAGPRLAALLCDTLETCYGPTVADLLGGGPLGCAGTFEATFENQTLPAWQAAIAAGTLAYDGTRFAECEAALRELGCDLTITRFQDLCEGALVGTLGPGAACSLDEECLGESFCDHTGGACPGTCQARGMAGAACTDDAGCRSSLLCSAGSCRAPGGVGASCEGPTNVRCGPGTICLGADAMAMRAGTCRTVDDAFSAALGASCDPQSQLCQEGLACQLDTIAGGMPTFLCVTPAAAGGACRIAIPDACEGGLVCDGVNPMVLDFDGTCAPAPGPGAPCGGLLARCAAGSRCVDGTCTSVSENGGTCATGAGCFSGACDGGVCVAPMLCGS